MLDTFLMNSIILVISKNFLNSDIYLWAKYQQRIIYLLVTILNLSKNKQKIKNNQTYSFKLSLLANLRLFNYL